MQIKANNWQNEGKWRERSDRKRRKRTYGLISKRLTRKRADSLGLVAPTHPTIANKQPPHVSTCLCLIIHSTVGKVIYYFHIPATALVAVRHYGCMQPHQPLVKQNDAVLKTKSNVHTTKPYKLAPQEHSCIIVFCIEVQQRCWNDDQILLKIKAS